MRTKLHLSKDELDALDDLLDTLLPLLGKSRVIDYIFRGIVPEDLLSMRIKLFKLRESVFHVEHKEINRIEGGKGLPRGRKITFEESNLG